MKNETDQKESAIDKIVAKISNSSRKCMCEIVQYRTNREESPHPKVGQVGELPYPHSSHPGPRRWDVWKEGLGSVVQGGPSM